MNLHFYLVICLFWGAFYLAPGLMITFPRVFLKFQKRFKYFRFFNILNPFKLFVSIVVFLWKQRVYSVIGFSNLKNILKVRQSLPKKTNLSCPSRPLGYFETDFIC